MSQRSSSFNFHPSGGPMSNTNYLGLTPGCDIRRPICHYHGLIGFRVRHECGGIMGERWLSKNHYIGASVVFCSKNVLNILRVFKGQGRNAKPENVGRKSVNSNSLTSPAQEDRCMSRQPRNLVFLGDSGCTHNPLAQPPRQKTPQKYG